MDRNSKKLIDTKSDVVAGTSQALLVDVLTAILGTARTLGNSFW